MVQCLSGFPTVKLINCLHSPSLSFPGTVSMRRCYSTLKKPAVDPLLLLESTRSFRGIKQIHARLITLGLIGSPITAHKLLTRLTLQGPRSVAHARKVFDEIPLGRRDVFIYNAVIKACSLEESSCSESFMLFRRMTRDSGFQPNGYSYVFVLKACGDGLGIQEGEQVRCRVVKEGFEENDFVTNATIGMYASSGAVEDARKVFDCTENKDLYTWNIMLNGYVMKGRMVEAKKLFNAMEECDVVSWTSLISGYVQLGYFLEALELFNEMLQYGAKPNQFTFTSALTACANVISLDQGRWIHMYIKKGNVKMNDQLLAGLVDMYAKCGQIESAREVFNSAGGLKREVWPWNAMIGGLAMHGKSTEAFGLFEQMKAENISPNKVTFVALLNACSHGIMVAEGKKYFESMKCIYGIEPEIEHYGCIVDLLGRAGQLNVAEEMVSSLPMKPDMAIWSALLGACRIHRDIERGQRVGKIIREFDHVGCDVLLRNVYSQSGRRNEANTVRVSDQESAKRKIPGCSSIELDGIFHQFLAGDRSHPQTRQIYMFLEEVMLKLKIAGYIPELGEVLLDVESDEDKETALLMHSEKLAIAFGLLNTLPGHSIRIVKNLRVCGDCHKALKFISKVFAREIIVRDRIRYHHFKEGSCSCNDYW